MFYDESPFMNIISGTGDFSYKSSSLSHDSKLALYGARQK
jgi:hypothetical protein